MKLGEWSTNEYKKQSRALAFAVTWRSQCRMTQVAAQTEENQSTGIDWHYVGFLPRALATLADALLVAAIVTPALVIIYGPGYLTDDQLVQGQWHVIIGGVLPAVAALWFLFRFQATPGKMIIRSQIVHQDTGDKPRRVQFIIRYLAFSLVSLPLLGIGCFWIIADTRKQGWHDKIARTVVVKRPL